MSKKVVLIDDDELFRAGLTRLIDSFEDFEVKLSICSTEFKQLLEKEKRNLNNNLILFSAPLNTDDGINMCETCVRFFSPSPVMIISNIYSKHTVIKAIESGVSAYFTKGISPIELENIMVELTANENFPDIKMELKVRKVLSTEDITNITFTEAEEKVLRLVCQQKSSSEISNDLGISVRTVESRKRNMMLKTHSKNMIGVVMIFMRSDNFRNTEILPLGR
ncbi:MAG: DNA-binding NarL/FixJ family response regulator [Crocinitomix sp.]|jgi:DNA-binding NarL/FixJ family response regulator